MNRAKKAGLAIGAFELLEIGFATSPLPDVLDIRLTTFDIAVAFVSVPLGVGAAIGLWRQQRWGWSSAMICVAVGLLDSLRMTVMDPDFESASIVAFGMTMLLYAAFLWAIDAERLRDVISPPLPDSGVLAARLYATVTKTGLAIVAVALIGSLWGILVLGLWVALMLWARARHRGNDADPQSEPSHDKALNAGVE